MNLELNRRGYDSKDQEERGRLLVALRLEFEEKKPRTEAEKIAVIDAFFKRFERDRTLFGFSLGGSLGTTSNPTDEQIDATITGRQ